MIQKADRYIIGVRDSDDTRLICSAAKTLGNIR